MKEAARVLELVVAKDGPKLAESVDRPPEPGGDRNPPGATRGADGFPLIPRPDMIFMDGKARWWVVKGTMQQFAEVLSSLLGRQWPTLPV